MQSCLSCPVLLFYKKDPARIDIERGPCMSTATPLGSEHRLLGQLHHLRDHLLLLLILGVALVFVGTLAVISAFIATMATVTLFGTLLFVGAIFQLVNALTCRNWRGFLVS